MHIIKNNKYSQIISNKTIFGFWLYIMSDCVLFASLFAVHAVLSNSFEDVYIITKDIFKLTFVFIETLCLLCSSLSCSYSVIHANNMNAKKFQKWIILTLLLGLCFINMEIYEFYHLILNGYNPLINAFFSSFFILVGTHGIHVAVGIIWIIIMIIHLRREGFTDINLIRLQCFSLFWHFLDIIWICVFSEVYLIGVL